MTDDELMTLAAETGVAFTRTPTQRAAMLAFAVRVAKDEREACAKVCESLTVAYPGVVGVSYRRAALGHECASAIRTRSNKKWTTYLTQSITS